ncbi:LacI family DNA-binding transcriptional regulator [Coraliomargarita sp. SDUM461004]|uniref:LacI family DNA-binding transcriptional regulator n=1 Tax=Thalassobacterium sedimentorum TaxID=3041258 RepID=A0ABU1AJD2_9BACT|nr:hypothetical protein [Coraliomargarita sp. SDUM461004]MDQ8194812.1 LacI family DNA-binding transcriptional regulator [Coraliomargarita sp. SDUM461004]
MEPPKRILQRDLAQLLNMSQVTVSRTLSHNPLVSDETKQPIASGQTIAWITGQTEKHSKA